jgi:hypothetical protein
MRVIIAGSRTITDCHMVSAFLDYIGISPSVVLCGGARGVDRCGADWARNKGITVEHFPADWARYGRRAGYIRNADMAKTADALVLIWDGSSPGSKNMKKLAERYSLKIYELVRED